MRSVKTCFQVSGMSLGTREWLGGPVFVERRLDCIKSLSVISQLKDQLIIRPLTLVLILHLLPEPHFRSNGLRISERVCHGYFLFLPHTLD